MTEENGRVSITLVSSPKVSTRIAAQELFLPRTLLFCLIHKLNLNLYRPRLFHCFLEDYLDLWLLKIGYMRETPKQ